MPNLGANVDPSGLLKPHDKWTFFQFACLGLWLVALVTVGLQWEVRELLSHIGLAVVTILSFSVSIPICRWEWQVYTVTQKRKIAEEANKILQLVGTTNDKDGPGA